jgi:hypothetical protein
LSPSGIQYVAFNALRNAGVVIGATWDEEMGIWFVWVLSPTVNVVKILDTGDVESVEVTGL